MADPDDRQPTRRERARAREIYAEAGGDDPDPVTRREAVEGELEDEGLSEAGEELGEHNE
jgi:hypothetical protein